MSANERPSIVATSLVVVGVAVLALGVAWPSLRGAPSEAEKQQAADFLRTGGEMEAAASAGSAEERARRIAEVRDRYEAARSQAEAARSRPQRTAFWMKLVGGALAALGAGWVLATRQG